MRFLPDRAGLTIAVIGFGYVGSCLAATLADRGHDVIGIDRDAGLIEELTLGYCRIQEPGLAESIARGTRSGRLRLSTDPAATADADVILIAVGTPIRPDGSLSDEQLRGACLAIAGHLRAGQLVVVKSTVPPRTTRSVVLPLLESGGLRGDADFGLAFAPERLAEGTAMRELSTFPIVASGLGPDSREAVIAFLDRTLGVEVVPVDSIESAEIVKLADNWWIDLNIALANELAKFCDLYGADVLDVIAAANTIPKGTGNVNILLPSIGVGGACLTKDPWMVWQAAAAHGVDILTAEAGRRVNEAMPRYTARLTLDALGELGVPVGEATVAVLGLAFKNNTGDLRETPVRDVVRALVAAGAGVRVHDPLVDPRDARAVFGVEPSPTVEAAVAGADAVLMGALHRELTGLDFAALPVRRPCLLVDGRAYYSAETVAELQRHGYVYRGIGRAAAGRPVPAAADPRGAR